MIRARLVLDCTPDEFAAACGPKACTLDVTVVEVKAEGGDGRGLLVATQRQRTHDDYTAEGDAGAPLRLLLAPAGGTHDG